MNISITIIEDKAEEQAQLIEALHDWGRRKNITLQISYFYSGENYFNANNIDESHLYILDIQLKGMDGITIAQKLRTRGYKGIILFLSAFQEYVFQGYDVHALHYLLKPVIQEQLDKCLDDVQLQLSKDYFLVRNGIDMLQIPYQDIVCFSSRDHFVDITTTTKEVYSIRQTLKNILPFLPCNFIQCHRSYIINIRHILSINSNILTLPNNETMVVGRNYMDTFQHEYARFTSRLF